MNRQIPIFVGSTRLSRGPLVHAKLFPFSSFNARYAGQSCYIVGRGVTDFNYADLANLSEPVFFINDAVCLERYVRSDSYFFAHDPHLLPWLDGGMKSTAVLPIDGKLFAGNLNAQFAHAVGVVYYYWRERRKQIILGMTRDQLAEAEMLYTHSGTIHSALHFAWYCGFRRVNLIGCDGLPRIAGTADAPAVRIGAGHDPRLENRSHSEPAWQYDLIRQVQDSMVKTLRMEAVYLGTPLPREASLNR